MHNGAKLIIVIGLLAIVKPVLSFQMHHHNQEVQALDQSSDSLIDQQIDAITLVGSLKNQLDTET